MVYEKDHSLNVIWDRGREFPFGKSTLFRGRMDDRTALECAIKYAANVNATSYKEMAAEIVEIQKIVGEL